MIEAMQAQKMCWLKDENNSAKKQPILAWQTCCEKWNYVGRLTTLGSEKMKTVSQ